MCRPSLSDTWMWPVPAAGCTDMACTWAWWSWPSSAATVSGSKWITVAPSAVTLMARQAPIRQATVAATADTLLLLGRDALGRFIRGRLHPTVVPPVSTRRQHAKHGCPRGHHGPRPRRPGMTAEGHVACLNQPVGRQELCDIVQESVRG